VSGGCKKRVTFDEVYRIATRRSERILNLGNRTYGMFTGGYRDNRLPGTTLANLKRYLLLPARVRYKMQFDSDGTPMWETAEVRK